MKRVIWFTGISNAGKTTLAQALARALADAGDHAEILDSDRTRAVLAPELGFSRLDRDRNVERLAFVASLLAKRGVTTIVAAVSPFCDARDRARATIEAAGATFVDVYLTCAPDVAAARDRKGLYGRSLPELAGVSSPYEPPPQPALTLATDTLSIEECVVRLRMALTSNCVDDAPL